MNEDLKLKAMQALQDLMAEFPDSLEIGTPATGGALKIYHRADDLDGFKRKIDAMLEARKYALEQGGFAVKEAKK